MIYDSDLERVTFYRVPYDVEAAQAANEADALAAAEAEIATLRAKNAELSDQFLRAQADVQNARRRADEEISKGRKFAIESFADSLLPVLDSLEAGLALPDATTEQIREGTEATLRQLKGALDRNKVIEIAPASGSQFALLPPDNATGNFTKVVQRIPVKIALDDSTFATKLRPGISVVATVRTRK